MINVQVSKVLSQILAQSAVAINEADLINEFTFWAEHEFDDRCTDLFSYKKKDDHYEVFHAHMRPVQVGDAQSEWDFLWDESFEKGKEFLASHRTSDCYLLYAHSANRGYYLIDILFDPGAHEKLWNSREGLELRKYYGDWAKDFLTHGTI